MCRDLQDVCSVKLPSLIKLKTHTKIYLQCGPLWLDHRSFVLLYLSPLSMVYDIPRGGWIWDMRPARWNDRDDFCEPGHDFFGHCFLDQHVLCLPWNYPMEKGPTLSIIHRCTIGPVLRVILVIAHKPTVAYCSPGRPRHRKKPMQLKEQNRHLIYEAFRHLSKHQQRKQVNKKRLSQEE